LDDKRYAPATLRNRKHILAVLRALLPDQGRVLEVAAGTGEHAAHFSAALPNITWQPTDIDAVNLRSIEAWTAESKLSNLKPACYLDVNQWPENDGFVSAFDAVVCINMIHISPWSSCRGLIMGAASALCRTGFLLLYGPFKVNGQHTAPSNVAFDASLKEIDPAFGVRDLDQVSAEALSNGLILGQTFDMPANNLTVVYRKSF